MRIVLIIAADPSVAALHRARLEADGFRVEAAGTAAEGLALARERPPAAVVADIDLPDLNGAQLAAELRTLAGGRALPIIILGNTYLPLAMDAAQKAGATICLDKTSGTPEAVATLLARFVPEDDLSPAESNTGFATLASIDMLRQRYLAHADVKISRLRHDFIAARRENSLPAILPTLAAMPRPLEALATTAGAMGYHSLAQLASALSALAYHLSIETDKAKPSPLRTVGSALDALVGLCKTATPDAPGTASPLILAVDDLAVARGAIQRLFLRAQIHVVALHSPRLAHDVIRQNHFDLVLLDLLMPEMSGFDLCREIRALPHAREVPVIFVTGIDDFEARAQAKMHGGTDFIAKPYLPAELTTKALLHLLPGAH